MSRKKSKPAVRTILFRAFFALPDAQSIKDIKRAWSTLTDREQEVARLAAQRLKDAEIAEQLFLSQKTVGHHLSNILRKLDIDSRHDIKYIVQVVDNSLLSH